MRDSNRENIIWLLGFAVAVILMWIIIPSEKPYSTPVETVKIKAVTFTYAGMKDGEPVFTIDRKDVE